MPKELIQEFIGKVCSITMLNDSFGVTGKIIAIGGKLDQSRE